MVGSRRSEEVVEPNIDARPSIRALKRTLLSALRCVDPDYTKRPKMTQVVKMLESKEYPMPREDRRLRRTHGGSMEIESQRENSNTDRTIPARDWMQKHHISQHERKIGLFKDLSVDK